ncbi:tRNA nucleotidyltransferase (CCA-adding enzyme) [Melghirimyces profundicolus]|uniref:tRNA nucleotidyltransferase (CCA-adding enzyme) n=1 Tax=Melghirimyces profundicolus TaxID=1242148 RepID=A0A2T6BV41_9BACL|nr:CCA tRNA nucleotidyltransferase [Melghirimyces profundicolus]PTX59934.1 tRNA nucleotidyltransferase (CCA-adding enzyme) [Melghirimyces profundicolus]
MTEVREAAFKVLARLEKAGHQAYLVGGCVRDRLLGMEPADYDIATDARPERVQALFPKTVATGLKHGTVTVLMDGQSVEVTTFRRETGYRDHRRPDRVRFVTELRQDLSRRDFTVNAMAEDRRGRLHDPFNGAADLKQGVIRTVGRAEDRFAEDALRMIRALRFSAQLGFRLEKKTRTALERQKPLLRHLAVERVTGELEKVWKAEEPSRALRPLWEMELFPHLPPFAAWGVPVPAPRIPFIRVDTAKTRRARWSLFLHLCGVKGEEAERRLSSFRLSANEVRAISTIHRLAVNWDLSPQDVVTGKKRLLRHGFEPLEAALTAAARIRGWESAEEAVLRSALHRWHREMPVHRLEELRLNGQELIRALHQPPGPWVGSVLQSLLEKAALGEVPNEREALIREGRRLVEPNT